MSMKNFKKILLIATFLIAFAVIGGALLSRFNAQEDKDSVQSTEGTAETAEHVNDSEEDGAATLYKDGAFIFTAGEFRELFADTLPEGYIFAEAAIANPAQSGNMQLDILDGAGISTDLAILMNVKEPDSTFSQIALIIKEGGYKEDAAAMLEWYLSTFLDSFEPEKQASMVEEYLDMFDRRAEEYLVYSSDAQDVMMNYVTEKSGGYYYVMITIQ